MESSNCLNPNPSIFQPITPEIIELIKNDSICLQSPFSLSRQHAQQVNLSLSSLYLSVYLPHKTQPKYLYHAELSLDIKFETIYQLDNQCAPQEAVFSKPIGFRIFKDDAEPLELYIKCLSLAPLWIRHLSKHLNQYGFHKIYKFVKKIDKGGFANVYQVERVTDKQHFAVKAFTKKSIQHASDLQSRLNLLNQMEVLRTFDSPHIIKCQGIYESERSIYIVLEYLPEGQLHNRINQRNGNFSSEEIKQFIKGMALGLKEMHDYRIMHRDIKPENIMMRGKDGLCPVIVDFGLSADVDSEDYIYYRCGTPGYVAPEVTKSKKGDHIQPQCDIFSLGTIFHIMLVRKQLFEGKTIDEVYQNNKQCKFNLKSALYKRVDSQALDLLKKMLKVDPKERIKASEILKHPYITGSISPATTEKEIASSVSTVASNKGINFSDAEEKF